MLKFLVKSNRLQFIFLPTLLSISHLSYFAWLSVVIPFLRMSESSKSIVSRFSRFPRLSGESHPVAIVVDCNRVDRHKKIRP